MSRSPALIIWFEREHTAAVEPLQETNLDVIEVFFFHSLELRDPRRNTG